MTTLLLTADQEVSLSIRVANGDCQAREDLVLGNLGLVHTIASGFRGKRLDFDDLVAEGYLGLMRAAESFDGTMGTRFSTFAGYWIKQSIRRALTVQGKPVRFPAYLGTLVAKWRRVSVALADRLGRQPTDDEIANDLGLRKKQTKIVLQAIRVKVGMAALDETGDAGFFGIADIIPDDRTPRPDEIAEEREEWAIALERLDQPDDRESLVVRMRLGLGHENPATLRETGERLGMNRNRVHQIELGALARLAMG